MTRPTPARPLLALCWLGLAVGLLAVLLAPTERPAQAQASIDPSSVIELVISGNRTWALVDGERHPVDAQCRSEIEGQGGTFLRMKKKDVRAAPLAASPATCGELITALFGPSTEPTATATPAPPATATPAPPATATPEPTPTPPPVAPTPTATPAPGEPTATPTPEPSPEPTATPEPPNGLDVAANLELIRSNPTRNTMYDDNPYRDVPMSGITVEDLTRPMDLYSENLLDTTNSGYFRVKCDISHFAYDDPIVFPNQPGRAHLHMFFGNTESNAYSTFDSLLNTGTGTCNGEDLNRTSYWVPAMLDADGNALIPFEVMVYYKNDNFLLNGANELVNPFPDNLRMVVGDAGATTATLTPSGVPGSQPVASFLCGPPYGANNTRSATIPDCFGTAQSPWSTNALEMQIAFPQCHDPSSGTYVPGGTHMSYSEYGYYGSTCPDSHPYDVSSIMYRIFYSPAQYGGELVDLHLSSDVRGDVVLPGGTTAHADWFGAWHPEAMDLWVENCNNTQADCEIGLLRREPPLSLVPRKTGFYEPGYLAPAAELIQLCPGKLLDPAAPLESVALCRTG